VTFATGFITGMVLGLLIRAGRTHLMNESSDDRARLAKATINFRTFVHDTEALRARVERAVTSGEWSFAHEGIEVELVDEAPLDIVALAKTFPTLANGARAVLVEPFDAEALDAWATTAPERTTASEHAARFILSVYNFKTEWKCGAFYATPALAKWDDAHRAAFLAWARRPWFA
jgi:hypothetical protein